MDIGSGQARSTFLAAHEPRVFVAKICAVDLAVPPTKFRACAIEIF
jgi:hypothetical protein